MGGEDFFLEWMAKYQFVYIIIRLGLKRKREIKIPRARRWYRISITTFYNRYPSPVSDWLTTTRAKVTRIVNRVCNANSSCLSAGSRTVRVAVVPVVRQNVLVSFDHTVDPVHRPSSKEPPLVVVPRPRYPHLHTSVTATRKSFFYFFITSSFPPITTTHYNRFVSNCFCRRESRSRSFYTSSRTTHTRTRTQRRRRRRREEKPGTKHRSRVTVSRSVFINAFVTRNFFLSLVATNKVIINFKTFSRARAHTQNDVCSNYRATNYSFVNREGHRHIWSTTHTVGDSFNAHTVAIRGCLFSVLFSLFYTFAKRM